MNFKDEPFLAHAVLHREVQGNLQEEQPDSFSLLLCKVL